VPNILQANEIILRICEPRTYSGREAHATLNRLSKELHEAILSDCSLFVKPKLIPVLYGLFDESCFNFLLQEHFDSNDPAKIYSVEKSPTIFRYLLEATILCPETNKHMEITKLEILSLIRGAHILTEACAYSEYLHRNDFAGGFVTNDKGEIHFSSDEKLAKTRREFLAKMALLSEKMKPDVSKLEMDRSGNIKSVSLIEDAIPYDALFVQTYNVKLSTIVGTAESIAMDICSKGHVVEVIPQNTLLKKIRRHTPYSKSEIKKSLQFLSIDKSLLSKEYQYYRIYDAPVSVSRQPIIRLFDGRGDKGSVVCLGRNALFRALLLLFADIDRGVIKLGDVAKRWDQEKGPEFEKNVKLALSTRGFKVIRVTEPPSDIGEIDAVACYEKKQVLLIVEAKAQKLDLSMDKAKLHYERSRKWCQRHDKKVKWAKENIPLLVNRLNLGKTQIKQVIGVIVTRVPWYTETDLPYKILSFEEFERLLDQICNA